MNKYYQKRLKRFLKEIGLFKYFLKKVEEEKEFNKNKNINEFLEKDSPLDIFTHAFYWGGTIQGTIFWYIVSSHWNKTFGEITSDFLKYLKENNLSNP